MEGRYRWILNVRLHKFRQRGKYFLRNHWLMCCSWCSSNLHHTCKRAGHQCHGRTPHYHYMYLSHIGTHLKYMMITWWIMLNINQRLEVQINMGRSLNALLESKTQELSQKLLIIIFSILQNNIHTICTFCNHGHILTAQNIILRHLRKNFSTNILTIVTCWSNLLSMWTFTLEPIHFVNTNATSNTWAWLTFINFFFTVISCNLRRTNTDFCTSDLFSAGTAFLTSYQVTFRDIYSQRA